MKDRTKSRAGKRIMAAILSFVMVLGIFSGMKLDAEAAGTTYSFSELQDGKVQVLYDSDKIEVDAHVLKGGHPAFNIYIQWENNSSYEWAKGGGISGEKLFINIVQLSYKGKIYSKFKLIKSEYMFHNDNRVDTFDLYLTPLEDDKNGTSSESDSAASSSSIPSHTCSFQWVTTIDPATGADGLEEYKCAGCGLVKESHPIPASVATVKDFYGNIKEAPENGSITYDSGKLYTISDYLLKKMSERNDVTVTVNFEYQNAKYVLTFPAGTDYTSVLTDEDTMYGYFGVAANLGLTVVAK